MRLVRSFTAAAVLAAGVVAGSLATSSFHTHAAAPTAIEAPHRFFPHPAPASTEPITFHGGPVMTGTSHLYIIWYGPWSSAQQAARRALLTEFVQHLDGPWWAINTAYTGRSGARVGGAPVLTKELVDTGSAGVSQLTDAAIGKVVQRALSRRLLPLDGKGIYLVLTSSSVSKVGFLTQYCGWHSWFAKGKVAVKYAFVGDPTGALLKNCSAQSVSPNGDVAGDAMVSTIAHELTETVTDPTMKGWRTARGEENADRCAWQYGKVRKLASGAFANMTLGARDWLVQLNWVNDSAPHCGLA
jgi:hypothetical protein